MRIALSLLLLIVLLLIALQFSAVQTFVARKATEIISERTTTEVSIERIGIKLPKAISLRGLYVEDMQRDTLLYVGELTIDVRMLALLRNNVNVNKLELKDATVNITRLHPDTLFNFDYLLMALSGEGEEAFHETEVIAPDDDSAPAKATPWGFAVDVIRLKNIHFRFADHFAGMDMQVHLGEFQTAFDVLDPAAMVFDMESIRLRDAGMHLFLHEATEKVREEKETSGAMPALGIGRLTLENIDFALEDDKDFAFNTMVNHLDVRPRQLDLQLMFFDLESFIADGLVADISAPPRKNQFPEAVSPDAASESVKETANALGPSFHWREIIPVSLVADFFQVKNAAFAMQETGQTLSQADVFDPANFRLMDLTILMENVHLNSDSLGMHLQTLSGREAGGFELQQFSAKLALGREARIDDLRLQTAESLIRVELETSAPVLDFDWPLSPHHKIEINLPEGYIGSDLTALIPGLEMLFPNMDSPRFDFDFHARGRFNELAISRLSLSSADVFKAELADAKIGNPLVTDSLHVEIENFMLTAKPPELIAYLPADQLPDPLYMPGNLSMIASFQGYLHDFIADLDLQTDFADLEAGMLLKQAPGEEARWDLLIDIQSGEPLAVTGEHDLIRDLLLSLRAKGKGFDIKSMKADAELLLKAVCFNDYEYEGLEITFAANEGLVDAIVFYDDEHLSLDFEQYIDLSKEHPHIIADWHIKHFNALELGFADELLALQAKLHADVVLSAPDFFDGSIRLDDTHVLVDREVFSLDSLLIVTQSRQNHYAVDVYSPILGARYRGNISPAQVPASLAAHLNSYMNTDFFTVHADTIDQRRQFQLSLDLRPSPYYTEIIIPQLASFDPISMLVSFDSDSQIISLDADIPDINIMDMHLKGLRITADSDPEQFDFSVRLPSFKADPLSITNIIASGHFVDRKLFFDFSFDDSHKQPWLGLSGRIRLLEELTEISLDREMLVNKQSWQVSPGNFLHICEDHLLVNDLRVSADGKEIAFFSENLADKHSPLNIRLQNIDLGQFDLLGDEPIAEGIFNGAVTIMDVLTRPSFLADLTIDALGYGGDKIGDLHVRVDNPEPGLFNAEASLSGYGNVLDIEGVYLQDDQPFMDFVVRLEKLDIATLEAFTVDELRDMEGIISGELSIKGDPAAPDVDGAVHFDQLGFHVSFLNLHYAIIDETLRFDKHMVRFDRFSLTDRGGREATLDGNINFADFSAIRFDLRLSSSNFLIMDIPKGQNELFYGRLLLDTDLNMLGDLNNPLIEGSLKLNQGSSFALIVPQSVPEAIGDEGVVEFISIRDDLFADLLLDPPMPDPMMSAFNNLNMSVNVEIDPQTLVTIVVDEHAGDYLEIRGGGLISYGIDPGGRISLAGRYEISDGSYQMTFYDVIRRNFNIVSGSHIIWTGDPLDATVDISARHVVRTSARELMATHSVPGGDQEPGHRRQYPFDVFLHMRGELMNPDISFELGLPPEHRGAMDGRLLARLNQINQDESELNKQVFALLILGNFIQDDPLAAVTAGPGISTTARTSASRLLSQQLNRLSDRYIRGVELSFDVESFEEFEDGQLVGRTELQMEVSRDFFDQRLRITAGGHIELEDETRRQLNPADIAGDFMVEYLLLPDGRLVLKGFRQRNFQDVYDGELVETGIAVIFRQTYDRFRELFKRRKERPSNNNETEELTR